VRASEQDVRALAAIVSQDRSDVPGQDGLPPSLLADLMAQIPCEAISLEHYDTGRQVHSWLQGTDAADDDPDIPESFARMFWTHYWDCRICSYPISTGDVRSVVKTSDFYSARQWHSTGMYSDYHRPYGIEHELQLCLHDSAELSAGPERHVRLYLYRGPGPDFSERDRAVLTLLRPHLRQAYLEAERRRNPVPRLTPRQWELLRLLAAGHTNTQIGRRLGVTEGTVRTHLENIYERLHVSSRTAAVTRAFPAGPPSA
jgi:DNA-binding CsgD family transcriptional regulator